MDEFPDDATVTRIRASFVKQGLMTTLGAMLGEIRPGSVEVIRSSLRSATMNWEDLSASTDTSPRINFVNLSQLAKMLVGRC